MRYRIKISIPKMSGRLMALLIEYPDSVSHEEIVEHWSGKKACDAGIRLHAMEQVSAEEQEIQQLVEDWEKSTGMKAGKVNFEDEDYECESSD